MQLVRIFFALENIKKMPSKVAYFTAQSEIFSTANQPKTSPNIIFCSIKMAHRGIYIYLYYNDFDQMLAT